MCLGSNGVDRLCLVCIDFFAVMIRSESLPKHEFRVQSGGSVAYVAKKFQRGLVSRVCALVAQVRHVCIDFRAVTKWSESHQNMSLGSNTEDRVRSLRKIPT
jgi:hypothetical protein